jgi:hypothetical protein
MTAEDVKMKLDELMSELDRDAETCVESICSLHGCDNPNQMEERLLCVNFTRHIIKHFIEDQGLDELTI